METISFIVYGEPIPQGSMRAFLPKGWKRPIVTADNKRTKPWRQDVKAAALEAVEKAKIPLMGRSVAVSIACNFYFTRPKSAKKSITHKTTKPDCDKLGRAILDALTGVVFEDDSQVVSLSLLKDFAPRPHAQISVVALS
jgi:crossover junction endodeoxyribonuclease RusA